MGLRVKGRQVRKEDLASLKKQGKEHIASSLNSSIKNFSKFLNDESSLKGVQQYVSSLLAYAEHHNILTPEAIPLELQGGNEGRHNLILLDLILYHWIPDDSFLPVDLKLNPVFIQELETFRELRRLDEDPTYHPVKYKNILENAPLAEIVRVLLLSSFTVFRDASLKLLISLNGSNETVLEKIKRNLAERILSFHAAVGDLLGFGGAVRNMKNFAALQLHPEAYKFIAEETVQISEVITDTQEKVDSAANETVEELKKDGLDAVYIPRTRGKGIGSLTLKILDRVKSLYGSSDFSSLSPDDLDLIRKILYNEIHDLVAGKIIIRTRDEDGSIILSDKKRIRKELRKAASIYWGKLNEKLGTYTLRKIDARMIEKVNGYKSLHVDVEMANPLVPYVNSEMIFRTDNENDYAEYGGAAHWFYKGKTTVLGKDAVKAHKSLIGQMKRKSGSSLISRMRQEIPSEEEVKFVIHCNGGIKKKSIKLDTNKIGLLAAAEAVQDLSEISDVYYLTSKGKKKKVSLKDPLGVAGSIELHIDLTGIRLIDPQTAKLFLPLAGGDYRVTAQLRAIMNGVNDPRNNNGSKNKRKR
ncbi:hypothetical protein JXB01_02380 [Candidatus Micrarchaeota archaeon]|nr:hypothetical protein [Candidatus Micrarchaeota archaeon]